MVGIVINNDIINRESKDNSIIKIAVYDWDNKSLQEIIPAHRTSHGNFGYLDFVFYDSSKDSIFTIYDETILLHVDELVLMYKEYLKIARDLKIEFLTNENITIDYNNDQDAKKLFKKICSSNPQKYQELITQLGKIEVILKTILNKLKEHIDEKDLYYLFFNNSNEDEKKHSYSK